MKRSRNLLAVVIVALAMVLACCCTACSLFSSTYEPVSYGNQDGSQCYYLVDPGETALLKQHHKCKDGAQPTLAPEFYVASYYPFLSGSFYRDTYIPSASCTGYEAYMASFASTHAADIKMDAPKAQYVDENGNVAPGSDIGISSDGMHISSGDGTSFGDTGSTISTDPHSGTVGDPNGVDTGGGHGGGVPDDHPVIDPGK